MDLQAFGRSAVHTAAAVTLLFVAAGVEAHVHARRAAFAVYYLERFPGDVEALEELLGQRSIATTQVYVRKLDRASAMGRFRGLS